MIEKLQGRDMVNTHAVAKKLNELIDELNGDDEADVEAVNLPGENQG